MATWVLVSLMVGIASVKAADQTWIDGNANNDWSTTAPNWDAGVVWTDGNNAIFGGTGETIDVNGAVSVVNITFNVTGYDVGDATADGTFTLSGTPSVVTVAAATTNTISEVLAGSGGLTKDGAGVLELTGASSPSTGDTIVNAGILQWGATDVLPAGTVTVADGATVEWTTTVNHNDNDRHYTIQGTGVGGVGAVVNNSSGKGGPRTMSPLYLAADATASNSRRTDPYNVRLQGHTLTKIGKGNFNIRGSVFDSGVGGAITVDEGVVQVEMCNNNVQTVDGGIVVSPNAYFSALSYSTAKTRVEADIVLNTAGLVGTSYSNAPTIPAVDFYGSVTVNGNCDLQMGWTGVAAGRVNDETSRATDIHLYSTIGGGGNLMVNPVGMGRAPIIPGMAAPNNCVITFYATNTLTGSITFDQGTNVLTTSGAFTNCGQVEVSSGTTLVISNTVNALGDTASLVIANDSDDATGVMLDTGVNDTIGGLVLGGVAQTAYTTYGSTSSGAAIQNDEYFSGPGTVTLAAPPDMTWIDANANNDWSLTDPNWDAGVAWVQNANAIFGGTGEAVELEDGIAVGNMTFNVDGYSVADGDGDGSLTLSGYPSTVTVVNASEATTISKPISGSGGLTKAGDGTLTLSGADSSSTGDSLVQAGILYWGANDALPSGSVTVQSGATVDLGSMTHVSQNARAYTIAGTGTAGQGALIKTGPGSVMGGWGVNGLTLTADATIGGSSRFDIGGYVDFNGFVLSKLGNNSVPFRTANLQDSGGGVVINQGHMYLENLNITIAGPVIVNSGATLGTYVLAAGANTFTLPVTLNSGAGLWAAGQGPVAGPSTFVGTIACSGTTYIYTGYNGSAGANPGDMIVDSVISGSGILIVNDTATGRAAAADRTITLNAANTYSGSLQIERGRLLLSASGAINSCSSIEVFSGAKLEVQNTGGALDDSASLTIVDDGDTASGVTLAAGVDDTIGSLLLGGVLQTTVGTYGSTTSGADVQSDEYFSGDGVVRLVGVPAPMTWIDANANNDWSTTEPNWDAGVGWVQNASAIFGGTGEAVDLEAAIMVGNMTFNVDGYSIDDADGDGALTLSGAPSVVTVANAGETSTVSKVIQGSGGLTKAGDGTLALNGTNSTSTGATIISAGKVQWGATDSLPSGSVTVNDGATLEWTTAVNSGANQRPITISGAGVGGKGAVLNDAQNHGANLFNSLTLAANATVGNDRRMDVFNVDGGAHTLTKVGVGNLNLRSLIGGTLQQLVVNEGLAQFEGFNGTVPGGITVNSGAYMSVLANNTDRTLAADVALNGGGLVATWWYTSATNVTVSFLNPITVTGDCALQIGITDPVVVEETNGQVDMDVMDSISGAGNLTINPAGLSGPGGKLLRLLADNTGLTGTLTIGSGNAYVDDAGSNTGTLNSGPLVVNGNLWLDRSDAQTIDDPLSGGGMTVIRYDGDVTFDGNTVVTRTIEIANGSLTLANGADVTLTNALVVATRQRQTNDLTTVAGFSIPNGCSLTAQGIVAGNDPGNLCTTLEATINQTGGSVETTGDVGEGGGLRLGHYPRADNVYNMSGGTLTIGGGFDLCPATDGAGHFNMTGGDVYTTRVMLNERNNAGGNGRLTLEGGTLHVGAGGITVDSPGPYTLNLGGAGGIVSATADFEQTVNATLYGAGANAAVFNSGGHTITVSGVLGGSGDLVKSGAGTLAVTAVCSYSGETDVNGGTLRLSGSGSLAGSADVEVAAGATLDIQNTGGALSDIGTLTVASDGDNGTGVTLGAGVDETVYALVLGGVAQTAVGTYGSTASGADYPNDEYFSGNGVVRLPSGNHWDGTDTTADADGGNGNWDLATANWDDDATGGSDVTWQNSPPTKAVFGGAAGTVEVDAAVAVAGLTFNTDGYTVSDGDANGTLTLSGSIAITVDTGMDATIGEQLTGTGGFVKAGEGGLVLSTDNTATLSGNVTVDAGTLYWGATGALPLTPTVDDVITVASGATVDFWTLGHVDNNSRRYAIAGHGVGGNGALVKTTGDGVGGNKTVGALKLLADSSIGGTTRFDVYGLDMSGFKLTKEGGNGIPIRSSIAASSGGLTLNNGTIYFENVDQVIDGPVVVNNGTYLGLYPYGGNTRSLTADITLSGGRLFAGSNVAGSDGLWYGTIAVDGQGNILTGGQEAGKYIPGAVNPGDQHIHSTISGTGDLYIMRDSISHASSDAREVVLYADNPFSGTVHIERGTCRLETAGTLLGAAQVNVATGVVFDIQNTTDALNDEGTLSIVNDMNSGTGVNLAAGVQEEVATLILGGVTYGKGDGSFGSSSSSAIHKDDEFFTGTGIIMLPEEGGTLFMIR